MALLRDLAGQTGCSKLAARHSLGDVELFGELVFHHLWKVNLDDRDVLLDIDVLYLAVMRAATI